MSMGNFYGSTPTAGLEVATFTTPLTIHIKQEAAMAFLRTKSLVKIEREKLFVHEFLFFDNQNDRYFVGVLNSLW